MRNFYMVTLGCPKNRVDSEVAWASMAGQGWLAVQDPKDADVIVVNTCAFVQEAVSESLDIVVELGQHRIEGRCSLLVVTGCLPARYGRDLLKELPEVDLFLGSAELGKLGSWLNGKHGNRLVQKSLTGTMREGYLPNATVPRVNSLSPGAAYLKVAEGCSRKCSFCLIPKLRGPQRSSSLEDLVTQTENLVELGVREVVLVAQDLAAWGSDLPGKPELADLVEALAGVAELGWIRLMYFFPDQVSKRLVRLFADQPNVLPYLDLPFQHVDSEVLRHMRRGGNPKAWLGLVGRLREEIPGMVLRSTLMTGFPGETDEAYKRLLDWVKACRFERLGVFVFSPEQGTQAARLKDRVPVRLARLRRDELMEYQGEIARDYHLSLVGTRLDVLVEERISENSCLGRAWNQAPEVDGRTVIQGKLEPGQMARVRVVEADSYDLMTEVVSDES